MTHSVSLTNWLLDNDYEHLRELADYLSALVPVAAPRAA